MTKKRQQVATSDNMLQQVTTSEKWQRGAKSNETSNRLKDMVIAINKSKKQLPVPADAMKLPNSISGNRWEKS